LRRPLLVAYLIALLTGGLLALSAAPAGATFIAPQDSHSPNADDISTIYWVMLILAVVIVVAINLGLVMAIARFRARRGAEPARIQSGRGVQGRVVAGLVVIAAAVFVLGIVFTEKVRKPEASGPNGLQASLALSAQAGSVPPPPVADTSPLHINVIGQRWLWRFEYPGGRPGDRTYSYEELVVPVDTTVILSITSTDVLHRWSVPALGGKVDAVPGQRQITWFKADQEGVYQGQSAAYSGASYPTMRATVRVVSPEAYQAFVEQRARDLADAQKTVQARVDAEARAAEAKAQAAEPAAGHAGGGQSGGAGAGGNGKPGGGGKAGGHHKPGGNSGKKSSGGGK
jgi:cytochrome c oxidase subunit 2